MPAVRRRRRKLIMTRKKRPTLQKAAEKERVVKVTAAKGRPMLSWVGKRPIYQATAFPAQQIEIFSPYPRWAADRSGIWSEWPSGYPNSGLLFHGDNKELLAHLLANGFRRKIHLIYIDPPFDSGADYVRKVQLRGVTGAVKLDGESYTLGEQIQYTDIWANDNYLQFMYERLLLLKELLADNGSIYLHTDWHKGHQLRSLMDEVFGPENFKNEIVWRYSKYQMRGMSRFVNNHDILYWYSKGNSVTYNFVTEPLAEPKLLKRKRWDKETGKIVNVRDEKGNLIYDRYEEGKVDDVWDIDIIGATSGERTDYPTQKPDALLERLICACSKPGDIVLDCFLGSGTAAVVSQKWGRRWIACDINKGAIHTTMKRLQPIVLQQADAEKKRTTNPPLLLLEDKDEEDEIRPAQLSFVLYRVNDYDLGKIEHAETVNLVCGHVGITRTKTDHFFEGVLGKRLVRIVPFDRPLTVLDLEDVKNELEARPDEPRDVVVVCLGKELAADAWVNQWNRLRKQGSLPNAIEVIELRSDPKYGKFLVHKHARAKVSIKRKKEEICIEIADFISPTIVDRLKEQEGLLTPQITDWRQMVSFVVIDPAYDGKVLRNTITDAPEKRDDLVSGKYVVVAPNRKCTVAVKIVDMLGEEVLVTQEV